MGDHVLDAVLRHGGEPRVEGHDPLRRAAVAPAGAHRAHTDLRPRHAERGELRIEPVEGRQAERLALGAVPPVQRAPHAFGVLGIAHAQTQGIALDARGGAGGACERERERPPAPGQGRAVLAGREGRSFRARQRAEDEVRALAQKAIDHRGRHPARSGDEDLAAAHAQVHVLHPLALERIGGRYSVERDRSFHILHYTPQRRKGQERASPYQNRCRNRPDQRKRRGAGNKKTAALRTLHKKERRFCVYVRKYEKRAKSFKKQV